jgi:hypothetical protein
VQGAVLDPPAPHQAERLMEAIRLLEERRMAAIMVEVKRPNRRFSPSSVSPPCQWLQPPRPSVRPSSLVAAGADQTSGRVLLGRAMGRGRAFNTFP